MKKSTLTTKLSHPRHQIARIECQVARVSKAIHQNECSRAKVPTSSTTQRPKPRIKAMMTEWALRCVKLVNGFCLFNIHMNGILPPFVGSKYCRCGNIMKTVGHKAFGFYRRRFDLEMASYNYQ